MYGSSASLYCDEATDVSDPLSFEREGVPPKPKKDFLKMQIEDHVEAAQLMAPRMAAVSTSSRSSGPMEEEYTVITPRATKRPTPQGSPK